MRAQAQTQGLVLHLAWATRVICRPARRINHIAHYCSHTVHIRDWVVWGKGVAASRHRRLVVDPSHQCVRAAVGAHLDGRRHRRRSHSNPHQHPAKQRSLSLLVVRVVLLHHPRRPVSGTPTLPLTSPAPSPPPAPAQPHPHARSSRQSISLLGKCIVTAPSQQPGSSEPSRSFRLINRP